MELKFETGDAREDNIFSNNEVSLCIMGEEWSRGGPRVLG